MLHKYLKFFMNLKNASILVIDDDPDVLTAVRLLLKTEAGDVVTEKNPENMRAILSKRTFDLILLDMNFNSSINTGNEGLFWLRKIKEFGSMAAVIMITAYGDIDLAVRSLKEGASDFVVKPWHNERLIATIKEALKRNDPKKVGGAEDMTDSVIGTELLGESEVMRDIFFKVEKIAPTDANILILGENGTGKDLIAKAIHQYSLRAEKPYIKVDVGALTETLFESELFGHKKAHLQMRAKTGLDCLKLLTAALWCWMKLEIFHCISRQNYYLFYKTGKLQGWEQTSQFL